MAHWAKPGVKVVCILWGHSDAEKASWFDIAPLVVDCVYTIREVVERPGGTALLLEEINNRVGGWFDFEMAYAIERFRPLTTTSQEDDVAAFRHLLEPVRADA